MASSNSISDQLLSVISAEMGSDGLDGVTQLSSIASEQANTETVVQSTASQAGGGSSIGDAIGSAFESVAKDILGSMPLVSGLLSLFGGGDSTTTTSFTKYVPPDSIQLSAGMTSANGGSIQAVAYGQNGAPQLAGADPAGGTSSVQNGSPITVQVQALDSQSFLDHSDDIASAVRTAILNSHPLTDVIAGL